MRSRFSAVAFALESVVVCASRIQIQTFEKPLRTSLRALHMSFDGAPLNLKPLLSCTVCIAIRRLLSIGLECTSSIGEPSKDRRTRRSHRQFMTVKRMSPLCFYGGGTGAAPAKKLCTSRNNDHTYNPPIMQ